MTERESEVRKLAAAVVSLLNQQTPDGNEKWTSADEALNDAAFLLYERALVNDLDFGMYMVEAGCSLDLAFTFIDTPTETLRRHVSVGGRYD